MTTDPTSSSCMELALEGEKLCKSGNCRSGVSFFEAAIQVGTEDLKTLSAVYSQLGNAYFYLQEYEKALEFHKHDLTLARTLGDRLGEAKASGNLGNTLKVLGKFEEAIVCCTRHLDISRELQDKVGEARALYNLGNVFHAKGKHLGRSRLRDPGDFPADVRLALERAVEFYEANLEIVMELEDHSAEGRAYGNLGNTHYLLGAFDRAVEYHEKRLLIARQFNDHAAERRAFSNLGNAHVFLGEFEIAAEYYKKTLEIAVALKDRAIEAQACYSLGNTYTLLKQFEQSAEYHRKHLEIAIELRDRVGQGRAFWSLGNCYTSLSQHKSALEYAHKHLTVSKEVGDRTGELTAEMNIADLETVLGVAHSTTLTTMTQSNESNYLPGLQRSSATLISHSKTNHHSAAERSLSTGDVKLRIQSARRDPRLSSLDEGPGDDFFDLLVRSQSGRMNDQRCEFPSNGTTKEVEETGRVPVASEQPYASLLKIPSANSMTSSVSMECMMDLMAKIQGDRMEEQRCDMPILPGLDPKIRTQLIKTADNNNTHRSTVPDERFFDMLMRCQATRMEDQRCDFPSVPRGPTVPDEDFFNLIVKFQSKRINDQRVNLPTNGNHDPVY